MPNWRVGVAISLTIASVMATQAQQGLKPARLTALDHIEIQQLVARFSHALHTAVDNGNTFADLFSADGTYGTATGRARLAALARESRKENANLRHFITNILIHSTAEGASGTQYELVFELGKDGKQSEIVRTGRYEDAYVKSPQGWRFKKREFYESIHTSAASKAAVLQPPQSGPQAAIIVAPQRSGTSTSLTEMDYLEIQQLVASYGHALDNGLGRADNGDAYAGLFTPDGVAFRRLKGYEQLAAIARAQPHGPRYVRHFLTNVTIAPSPEGATGKQYLVVADGGEGGKPGSLFLGGHYEDIYVRTPTGWRFKSRTLFNAQPGPEQTQESPSEPPPAAVRLESGERTSVGTSKLGAADYLEIQQLVARYGFALDTAAENGYMYADLYTPDGRFGQTTGRDQLAALTRGARRGPLHVRNYSSIPIIEPSPAGATGLQYAQALDFEPGGRAGTLDHFGYYEDVYVKTSMGWRFKSRLFVNESQAVLKRTPTSESRTSGSSAQSR
jgi:hypothetical protein